MSGTVKLPAHQAEWLIRGALAAASKDDVTPVLCAVQWTIADGRVTVTSTDRYRIHQLFVPAPEGTADGEFLMHREHAAWLLKAWHAPRRIFREQMVYITWTDPDGSKAPPARKSRTAEVRKAHGTTRFDVYAYDHPDADVVSYERLQVAGNFPPVARLFPDEADLDGEPVAQAGFVPELIGDTRHLRTGYGSLRFITVRTPTDDVKRTPNRQAPMLVVNTEGTARALIQPNLLLNTKRYGE